MATSVPTPTSTPLPAPSAQTVTFDDLVGPNRALTGQYPTGVVDWGSGAWYLSMPWGRFTTNSVSFNGPGATSASIGFVTPHRLVQIDAYNGGTASSAISLACTGQPTVQVTLVVGQLQSIQTGWTSACSTVVITSSNGWYTNFDNLVIN